MRNTALKIQKNIQHAIQKTKPALHLKEANEILSISAGTAEINGLSLVYSIFFGTQADMPAIRTFFNSRNAITPFR